MTPEILAHLWQSTLFVGAAWLVTLALRTNRAQVRYWIWFAASVKFLIPFSLLIGLGTLIPHRTIAPAIQTTWGAVVEELTQPLALPPIATHVPSTGAQSHNYVAAASALWACGLLAVTMIWLLRWRRVQILRRSAHLITLPTNLQIPVPIMSAPDVIEPGIYGLLRPVLLLPYGIADRLSQAQLDAILTHEFCHARRKDNLTAAIHMAVQAIFWFHPLTWLIGTRLVDERERACDEEVLRQGCKPNIYAESILTVCKLYLESPLTCVSGVTGSNLKKRIEEIMRNRSAVGLNSGKKLILGLAGIAALAIPIGIGSLNAPAILAQDAADWQTQPGGKMAFEVASAPPAMQPASAAKPQFEVASAVSGTDCQNAGQRFGSWRGGKYHENCQSLLDLIRIAYPISYQNVAPSPLQQAYLNARQRRSQIEGAPAWIDSDRYTVDGSTNRADTQDEDTALRTLRAMLQSLLEDKFRLRIHRETRATPIYEMTVVPGGPKLKPFVAGTCVPANVRLPDRDPNVKPCVSATFANGKDRTWDNSGATLLIFSISLNLDRPIIDKTGIDGVFDIHLKYSVDGGSGPANYQPIFDATQEQLGLKLVPVTLPFPVLVIDGAQRLSVN